MRGIDGMDSQPSSSQCLKTLYLGLRYLVARLFSCETFQIYLRNMFVQRGATQSVIAHQVWTTLLLMEALARRPPRPLRCDRQAVGMRLELVSEVQDQPTRKKGKYANGRPQSRETVQTHYKT